MHVVRLHILILTFSALLLPPAETSFFKSIKHMFSSSKSHNSTNPMEDPSEEHINIIIKHVDKRMTKRESSQQCNDDELMTYLAEIQVINPESIINLSTLDELPVVCKQVTDTLEGMEDYLKTCSISNEKDLYVQLLKGIARFVDVMCEKNTKIKTAFMEHFPCLQQLHPEFENCFGPADWTEDIKKNDICCAYKQIADCYYTKAAKVCGRKAARAIKHVVVTVIDAVIPVHCTMLLDPCVKDAAPNRIASHNPNMVLIVILIAIVHTSNL